MAGSVEQKIARAHFGRTQSLRTTQQGSQAREELFEIEGLGEVIVGAGIETGDAVVHGAAGREHEDGHAESGGAQFAADGVAVLHGHHYVEYDQIVIGYRSVIKRLFAIGRDIHGVGLFAQTFGDETGYALFILG